MKIPNYLLLRVQYRQKTVQKEIQESFEALPTTTAKEIVETIVLKHVPEANIQEYSLYQTECDTIVFKNEETLQRKYLHLPMY